MRAGVVRALVSIFALFFVAACSGSGSGGTNGGTAIIPASSSAASPISGAAAPPGPGPAAATFSSATSDTFVGKQPGWEDLKATFGARGDGVSDDTAALQQALDALGSAGHSAVLYIPAGTYRVTQTLRLTRKRDVAILGENPATTILSWGGGYNNGPDYTTNTGVMLLGQGSAQVKIGRLTFDGKGRLNWGLRWRWGGYSSQDFFPTNNQHFDLIFQDMDIGIGAGCSQCSQQDTAEYSHVYRTQFIRCGYAGLSTEDFNSLLWGVMDSYFEDSGSGVRLGTGNAAIYDSTFVRSKTSDITAVTIPIVSVRGSTSIGSAHFLTATGNTGSVTLQNNIVLDPTSIAVDTAASELTLVGNAFRTGGNAAVMLRNAAALSAGNRFSTATPFATQGFVAVRQLDDIPATSIADVPIARPFPPSPFAGAIVSPAAFTGAAIQSAVDQLAAANGGVVYLRTGTYSVDRTIAVPAGKDIRLIGDGNGRTLIQASNPTQATPVIRFEGPSHAVLQDVSLHGGYNTTPTADELAITNADQVDGAIIGYGLQVVGPNTSGRAFEVNGIDDTKVEFLLTHYIGATGESVYVRGGPNAVARASSAPNVRVVDGFPGVASGVGSSPTFRVTDGGRLIALDQWAEVNAQNLFDVAGSGNFTLSGGAYIFAQPLARPLAALNGFSGRVTLLGSLFGNGDINVAGANGNTNLLLAASRLDGWSQGANAPTRLIDTTSAGVVRQYLTTGAGYGPAQTPNAVASAVGDVWLRTMLADLRADATRRTTLSKNPAVTAVVLRRIVFESGNNALRITR